jgi:hypothetical protein
MSNTFYFIKEREMKNVMSIAGIVLIIFGIVAFAYQGISYTQRETVAEVGSLKVTADTEKTIPFSPLLGGLSLGAGIVLVVVSRIGRK